ncbi:lytic transglycosylase domain-containing protein [Streptomyces sp. NPDC020412]|uniref:lytic transglycosylase domain-containing protein n=1 Tax=Streptomyces sp. NPDC020412 TaxID=3365073 RepID=UPI0037A4450C
MRKRTRRGAVATAAAFAAMAALTASQAPLHGGPSPAAAGERQPVEPYATGPGPGPGPDDDVYHTELPPLTSPVTGAVRPGAGPAVGAAVQTAAVRVQAGIPATVLAAYRGAEAALRRGDPGCRLPWQLLAAIGKVESGQARGGRLDSRGTTLTPILGPVLDGVRFAHVPDTDDGAYDGDTRYDRAVGPMQFIPSTWAGWGQDANGDGRRDPHNMYDAALAAGRYLCAGGRDLTVAADLDRAVLSYNRSRAYVRTVLAWLAFYRSGVHPVPDGTGVLPGTPGAGGNPPVHPVGQPPKEGGGGIVVGPRPTPKPGPPSKPPRPGQSPRPSPSGPGTSPGPSPSVPGPSPSVPGPSPSEPGPSPSSPAPSPSEPAPSPSDSGPGASPSPGPPDPTASSAL